MRSFQEKKIGLGLLVIALVVGLFSFYYFQYTRKARTRAG